MRTPPRAIASGCLAVAVILLAGCATGIPEAEVADLYFRLGSAYFDLGEYENAVSAYSQALDLDNTLVKAGYNLAHVYLETGRIEEAKRMLEGLMVDEPENTILMSTLAWAHYREGNLEEALELYLQVRDRLEGDPDALFNTSTLLWELERYDEALAGFLELYALDENPEYLGVISELYAATGDHEAAIVYLERLIVEGQSDAGSKKKLAELYNEVRDYGDAVAMYDEIISEVEVADPEVLFDRAAILLVFIEDYVVGVAGIESALEAGFRDRDALDEVLEQIPSSLAEELDALAVRSGLTADDIPAGSID